jgi:hypothetical protein
LTFKGFNNTFYIHLEPNTDLIHPDAVVSIKDNIDGTVTDVPLTSLAKVFKGTVYSMEHSKTQMRLHKHGFLSDYSPNVHPIGTARFTLFEDGLYTQTPNTERETRKRIPHVRQFLNPVFEGIFDMNGEDFHLQPVQVYQNSKLLSDPELPISKYRAPEHKLSKMILYKNSDRRMSGDSSSSSNTPYRCGSNKLEVNGLDVMKLGQVSHHSGKLFKRAARGCPTSKKIAYVVRFLF